MTEFQDVPGGNIMMLPGYVLAIKLHKPLYTSRNVRQDVIRLISGHGLIVPPKTMVTDLGCFHDWWTSTKSQSM